MLVGISNYLRDPGQSGDLFRCPLRITTRHHDLAVGIVSLNTPNRGARVLVSCCGHSAGIQNDNVSFVQSCCWLQSAINELLLYSGAIRLRRSTAKILYVKTWHSHIVT